MSKKDILDDLKSSRADLLAAIEGLSEDEMMRPGVEGVWSVKDVMAHLIAWEAELITALSRKLGRRYKDAPAFINIEDIDEWNAEQYHLNVSKPLNIILPDFHGVHKHLLLAVEDLNPKWLDDPLRFEWLEGEPLSYLILETAAWHENEHAESIRIWREAQNL